MCGSFTAAAKTLCVSQPTITTQVKDLETFYGVELFHRLPRGVVLTDTGQKLLIIIRRIHVGQQDAVQFLQTVQKLDTGNLRIGSYGPYDVIEILAEFTSRYPGLTCSLTFANSQKLHEGLLNHSLDVAVFTPLQATSEFFALTYNKIRPVAIVSKSHRWSRRKFIHIKKLETERLIIRETGSEVRRATEAAMAASDTNCTNIIEIGSREGSVAAVAQGMGVCLILDESNSTIPEQLVSKIKIRGADIFAKVDVVCLAERKESRVVRSVFEVAEQLLALKQKRPLA
jgi:DNA-binding transcriptional LysR family regulator